MDDTQVSPVDLATSLSNQLAASEAPTQPKMIHAQAPDGTTLHIPIPDGTDTSKYGDIVDDVVSHYMSSRIGTGETLGRAAVNNLPLGGQLGALGTMAVKGEDYTPALADWNAQAAEAKKQNPLTYGVGATVGGLAPMAIPGVGTTKMGLAALGAANAAGNTNLAEHPGQALGEAALGAGTGALVGKAGEMVGGALPKVGSTIGEKMALPLEEGATVSKLSNRIEANLGAQALDLNTLGIRKLMQTTGAKSPEEAVLQTLQKIDEHMPDLIGPMDTANTKFAKVMGAQEKASDTIGELIKNIDDGNLLNKSVDLRDLSKNLREAAANYGGIDGGEKALLQTADRIDRLASKPNPTFQNLYDIKKAVGQGYHNPLAIPPGTDEVYSILNKSIEGIINRGTILHNISGGSEVISDQFQKAKEIFKLTKDLLPAMSRGAAREVAGPQKGLLPMAGIGSAMMGHPLGAVAAGAKGLQELVAPDLAKNLLYTGFKGIKNNLPAITAGANKVGQGMKVGLTDYLSSKYGNNTTPPVATTRNASKPDINGFSNGGLLADSLTEDRDTQIYNYLKSKHGMADGGAINLDDVKEKLEDYPTQDQGLEGLPWRTELPVSKDIPPTEDILGTRAEVKAPKNLREDVLKKMADGGIAGLDLIGQQEADEAKPDSAAQDLPMQDASISDWLAPYLTLGGAKGIQAGAEGLADLAGNLSENGIIRIGKNAIASTPEEIESTLNNLAGGLKKGDKIPVGQGSIEYVGKQQGFEHIPDQHLFNTFNMNNPSLPNGTTVTPQSLGKYLGDTPASSNIALDRMAAETPTSRVADMLASDADWSKAKNFGNIPKVDITKDITLPNAGMNALTTEDEKATLLNWLKKEYPQE